MFTMMDKMQCLGLGVAIITSGISLFISVRTRREEKALKKEILLNELRTKNTMFMAGSKRLQRLAELYEAEKLEGFEDCPLFSDSQSIIESTKEYDDLLWGNVSSSLIVIEQAKGKLDKLMFDQSELIEKVEADIGKIKERKKLDQELEGTKRTHQARKIVNKAQATRRQRARRPE